MCIRDRRFPHHHSHPWSFHDQSSLSRWSHPVDYCNRWCLYRFRPRTPNYQRCCLGCLYLYLYRNKNVIDHRPRRYHPFMAKQFAYYQRHRQYLYVLHDYAQLLRAVLWILHHCKRLFRNLYFTLDWLTHFLSCKNLQAVLLIRVAPLLLYLKSSPHTITH